MHAIMSEMPVHPIDNSPRARNILPPVGSGQPPLAGPGVVGATEAGGNWLANWRLRIRKYGELRGLPSIAPTGNGLLQLVDFGFDTARRQ